MVYIALALALAASPVHGRAAFTTLGCQGEACWTTGIWIVKAPLALYDEPAKRRIATLPRGTRLTARGGLIRTTLIGRAVLRKDVSNYLNDKLDFTAPKGTRVRVVYDAGEGDYGALMPDWRSIIVGRDDLWRVPRFRAQDWVEVTLPDGRKGWIKHDYARLDCSSYYDDMDHCRALGADNWSKR